MLSLLSFCYQAKAQSYNILIKGGHVIDPKNNIDDVMDVAIKDGKIAQVAKNIDIKQAAQIVNAKGLYVTPGLIDIHSHNFYGTKPDHQYENGNLALPPDGFTFRNGVTTVVDAGSSAGARSRHLKHKPLTCRKPGYLPLLILLAKVCAAGTSKT